MQQGYWFLHQAALDGTHIKDHDIPEMGHPNHFGHCADYLRQSLMCHADLTIEVEDSVKIGNSYCDG
jgi:hypothetical protein